MMRPVLSDSYDIVVRNNRGYVERRKDRQLVAALTSAEAVILGVMDGRLDAEELAATVESALHDGKGAFIVKSTMGRLRPLLVDGAPRSRNWDLGALSKVLPPIQSDGLRRMPGPRVLHWSVTQTCPRRCAYCFVDPEHGSIARDSIISRSELSRVLKEAATLGAEMLLLGGAEPLLRPDLPEIMGDAIRLNITPLVTTKHPISETLAVRFQRAGVRHISLSIDSMDPAECQVLIGSSRFPDQMRRSAQNLLAAGVAFSIQAVATRQNPSALEGVAKFAAESDARVMQIVPFEPVRRPITSFSNDDLLLSMQRVRELPALIERLQETYPTVTFELFEKLGSGSRDAFHCDIGQTKMFFLPNGIVHRCYKLTQDQSLQGPDLRRTSVAAAWHDPGFGEIISPPRQNYGTTSCGACSRFATCHDEGRCIYQALVDHGKYEDRDRECAGPYFASLATTQ